MKHQWYCGDSHNSIQAEPFSVLTGHIGIVWAVEFAPYSGSVATAGEDGLIRVWDDCGFLISQLEGHESSVTDLSWSPDGSRLASSSRDGSVRVWDVKDGVGKLIGNHCGPLTTVGWSRDGKTIASGSYDKMLYLWDVQEGTLYRTFKFKRAVTTLAWNPNGYSLLCGFSDGVLRILDNDSTAIIRKIQRGGRGGTTSVSWSFDGAVFAASGVSQSVPLFNGSDGRKLTEIYAYHSDWRLTNPNVACIRFLSNQDFGRLIAVKCGQTTSLWRWDKKDMIAFLRCPDNKLGKSYAGHGGIALNPQCDTIAVRDDQSNDVFLWSIRSLIREDDKSRGPYVITNLSEYRNTTVDSLASVFISYGGPDEDFAELLNKALGEKGVKTFLFKQHAKPGEKLHRLMRDGVNQHDRVILVCSRNSLDRHGVMNELEETLQRESREGGASILIPITLDGYVFAEWAPSQSGLAQAVRDRVVADFRGALSDNDVFEAGVRRLVVALSVSE